MRTVEYQIFTLAEANETQKAQIIKQGIKSDNFTQIANNDNGDFLLMDYKALINKIGDNSNIWGKHYLTNDKLETYVRELADSEPDKETRKNLFAVANWLKRGETDANDLLHIYQDRNRLLCNKMLLNVDTTDVKENVYKGLEKIVKEYNKELALLKAAEDDFSISEEWVIDYIEVNCDGDFEDRNGIIYFKGGKEFGK